MKHQNTLKLAAFLAVPMLTATWLQAEPPTPGGDRPEPPLPGIEVLKSRLGLSDEQTSKIESVFTDEQKAKWKTASERPERGCPDRGPGRESFSCDNPPGNGGPFGGPDGRPPCGGPGHFDNKGPHDALEQLQLTKEQQAKIKAIFEANQPKLQAARDEARVKDLEVRASIDSQIRPILTKEQQVVFDDLANLRKAEDALRKNSAELRKKE